MRNEHSRRDTEPPRVDLRGLDPVLDRARFEALASAIVRDAMAARSASAGVAPEENLLYYLARRSKTILLAAAAIVAITIPILRLPGPVVTPAAGVAIAPSPTPPDRFGIPGAITALAQSRADATPAQLVAAFDAQWSGAGGGGAH